MHLALSLKGRRQGGVIFELWDRIPRKSHSREGEAPGTGRDRGARQRAHLRPKACLRGHVPRTAAGSRAQPRR